MADQNDAHEHGSMDITEQEKTFAGFIKFCIYLAIGFVVIVVPTMLILAD